MRTADACLLEDELLEYQAGRCTEAQLTRFDAHLDSCASCRELVHHLLGRAQSGDDEEPISGQGWLTTFTAGSLVASRYLIRRFVGKGGMGEVYEAFDQLMAMRVALKTVLCTASDRPRAVHKLMDEVKNALRVGHPNVCRINELQEHRDPLDPSAAVPFFTMEFVDGERLGWRSKQGLLRLADVRCIARQLLDGLQAAHARGVLHLDLKSDNVLLRRGKSLPEVVIMDFGLSRALDRPSRRPSRQRFELAGTLPYMSLEQLESQPALGPASDVYSFGVVLYEMLTGRLPFVAASSGALLLEQLRTRPLPPSHYVPRLSPALDRFVLRCLANQASRRFPNAAAAREALDAIGAWERQGEGRSRAWCLGAALGGCALAVSVAFGAVNQRELAASPSMPPASGAAAASGVAVAEAAMASSAEIAAHGLELPRSSTSASNLRRLPVLPLSPPPLGQLTSKLRPREPATAGEMHPAREGAKPRSEGEAQEHGEHAAAGARGEGAAVPLDGSSAGALEGGASARADSRVDPERASVAGDEALRASGEDWTPRALPRSLLVPTRRTANSP